ncbi:Nucleotide-binding protein UspA family [Methanonatronarchaeum thermophilum]|uniref:Nucleotide-binding protein UspA family n=1 Tax=Methanonatronarchaeum thermophilum TaxID=1927129 RepID=A0A1Y3GFK9_9EURY|nr:universal stress protein [Methanonatronarchaeum thermophilum]OUJ19083.1 Nucleotide-binding protein UspA family [Methanonatronarchaeum thermophilum]
MTEKKILLATDGSKPALMATKKAIEEAKAINAEVHALTIEEKAPMTLLEKKQENIAEEKYLEIKSRGSEVAKKYGEQQGVKVVEKKFESGPVVAAIIEYAKEIDPELIVVGNSGRSGWEKVRLGSVAEGIVKKASHPVLVTRVKNDDYLKDILEIARQMPLPRIEELEEIKDIDLEELEIKKQLGLAFGTLLAFLIPFFGLASMVSWAPDLAAREIIGYSLNTALFWILLIFPLGWVTAILFNQYAKRYDRAKES